MIPTDEKQILHVLVELEKAYGERGWDQPPFLGMIYDEPEGVLVLPFPMQPISESGDTLAGMYEVVQFLKARSEVGPPPPHTLENLIGLVLVVEAWGHPDPPDDGRSMADVVGSKECRFFVGLDIAGRLRDVLRVRGGRIYAGLIASDDERFSGNVRLMARALWAVTMALFSSAPPGTVDLGALKATGVSLDA